MVRLSSGWGLVPKEWDQMALSFCHYQDRDVNKLDGADKIKDRFRVEMKRLDVLNRINKMVIQTK
jgi:hypothetical protein